MFHWGHRFYVVTLTRIGTATTITRPVMALDCERAINVFRRITGIDDDTLEGDWAYELHTITEFEYAALVKQEQRNESVER